MSEKKKVRQLNKEEILEKLRTLEGKQCSEYTEDDNYLMYSAFNLYGEEVYQVATRLLCEGMYNVIASKAGELLVKRGNVGRRSFAKPLQGGTFAADPDMLNDTISECNMSMLFKVKKYDPTRSAVVTYFFEQAMAAMYAYINHEASLLSIPTTANAQMYDIEIAKNECIKGGIISPTAKDIYNKLRQQGKDMEKYTITTITELLKIGQSTSVSLDDERNKQLSLEDSTNDVPYDMVNNIPVFDIVSRHLESEAVRNIIYTMNPLNRMALIAYIKAEEKAGDKTEEEKQRRKRISKEATEKDILKEFREMYKYDIKAEEFSRLLYYAKDELKKRFAKYSNIQAKKSAKTPTFNSLDSVYDDTYLDDIFEADIFNDEDERSWQEELEADAQNFVQKVVSPKKGKKNEKK